MHSYLHCLNVRMYRWAISTSRAVGLAESYVHSRFRCVNKWFSSLRNIGRRVLRPPLTIHTVSMCAIEMKQPDALFFTFFVGIQIVVAGIAEVFHLSVL